MTVAREKAFSILLTSDVGMRVRTIAARENRSAANVIESAVAVFTLFPRALRDILVEAASKPDGPNRMKELTRGFLYQDAMRRLDQAMETASQNTVVDPDANDYDDAVVVARRP